MSLRLSGGRRLQSPPGELARPTAARVRQAVFNLLAPELAGCHWLDLCCGSGVMACEALQRGARRVVAVERDRRIAAVARANLAAVSDGLRRQDPPPSFELVQAEVLSWLARPQPCASDLKHGRRIGRGASGRTTGTAISANTRGGPAVEAAVERHAAADAGPGSGPGADRGVPGFAHGAPGGGDSGGEAALRGERFDLIYADPPWPADLHGAIATAVARGHWLNPGGILVWECPSERVPAAPSGWRLRDSRRYGGSTVVLLEPDL